jgi:hypothetical protein
MGDMDCGKHLTSAAHAMTCTVSNEGGDYSQVAAALRTQGSHKTALGDTTISRVGSSPEVL